MRWYTSSTAEKGSFANNPLNQSLGIILCRHKEMLANSMHMVGSYIIFCDERDGMMYTAEMSGGQGQ